jgi:hypothetical protein
MTRAVAAQAQTVMPCPMVSMAPRTNYWAGILVLLCLLWHPLAAQSQDSLRPDIETVVTGGTWTSDSLVGYYRILIRTGGFDHLISTLDVEWISQASATQPPRLVRSHRVMDISAAGNRLSDPRFGRALSLNGWTLSVRGLNTHTSPATEETWWYDLGGPGEIRRMC